MMNPILPVYPDRGIKLIQGEGPYLTAADGKRYLDMMSNYGVSIFGYGHPAVTAALRRQLERITTLHGSFRNDVREEASAGLLARCGASYASVYWSNSGSEAVEAALKFATLASGKKRFLVCEGGYHGKTLGALSATAGEKYKAPFMPLLWQFDAVPFGDAEALAKVADERTAGFIIEPVQGEAGVVLPPPDYLKEVEKICAEKNILLILDEIQTGCGRTGKFLASEGVAADILCLGKGLAGGIPVGATLMSAEVAASVPKHVHTSTFGGNPLAAAGVKCTLELLDQPMLDHVQRTGAALMDRLAGIDSGLLKDVRGAGLIIGAEVLSGRNTVLRLMQENGVLVIPAGDNVVRFLPPFVIQEQEVELAARAFASALQTLATSDS